MENTFYIKRCFELARLGVGKVSPNPMVGCVIVNSYEEIIGEGYHRYFGGPHAEVNAIASIVDKEQLKTSTLYVNLEPCAHFGKTPPCSNLIIEQGIKKVVVGCRDSYAEVDGKGIEQLKAAGIEVIVDVLKEECLELNKRFFAFHTKKRPFIVLKFAKTNNGFIGKTVPSPCIGGEENRLFISNSYTNKLVHQWRSEEAAILVGTNTALKDNP